MHVCTIIGARPQFIKAGVVSAALASAGVDEAIVHTGQHYDASMSHVFFDQLGLREPAVNLAIGSGSHAVQTARMMEELERYLRGQGPFDWVLVYGDTNSTLAGALVAAKCGLPLAHVEAGLRSFNRRMPEEINRIVTDSLSDLLFAPTGTAASHLKREGVNGRIILSGDVMLDSTLHYSTIAQETIDVTALGSNLGDGYALVTVHRAANTDDPQRLQSILTALGGLDQAVVFPAHPRTQQILPAMEVSSNVQIIDPVGYLEMLALVSNATVVLTDSGGLQKEAYWLGTPCITLRNETEWVETLVNDWNQLAGYDSTRILEAVRRVPTQESVRPEFGSVDGRRASDVIASALLGGIRT